MASDSLSDLPAFDRKILKIVGPSSVVWKLEDLWSELQTAQVDQFKDTADLEKYLLNHPSIYTLSISKFANHVWSKVSDVQDIPAEITTPEAEPFELQKGGKGPGTRDHQEHNLKRAVAKVINLMQSWPHDSSNSIRTNADGKRCILYKTTAMHDRLPGPIKKHLWQTPEVFGDALFAEKIFYVGSHGCQLRQILWTSPHPDKVARSILDILIKASNATPQTILENLPLHMQNYLRNAEGVQGFIEFYPALFTFNFQQETIEAKFIPVFKSDKDMNLPRNANPATITDFEQATLNSIKNLMNNSHADKDNSKIFVVGDLDKPYYWANWVRDHLPIKVKENFPHMEKFIGFLKKFGATFIVTFSNKKCYIQLRSKLVDHPCDKSISLQIQLLHGKNLSIKDMFHQLPSFCTDRIRSVSELEKFLGLYPEFHETGKPHDFQNGGGAGAMPKRTTPPGFKTRIIRSTTPPNAGIDSHHHSGFWPRNTALNPVANLLNNCPHNEDNSIRLNSEGRACILFKMNWIYDTLPAQMRQNAWPKFHLLKDALYEDADFYVSSHGVHMKAILKKSPSPDKVARAIVEVLLNEAKGCLKDSKIYNQLPSQVQTYLKTVKGLKGFIQFYPALFELSENYGSELEIGLKSGPFYKPEKVLNLPFHADNKKNNEEQLQLKDALVTLMQNSLDITDGNNCTVFVVGNMDKPYYHMSWIFRHLPTFVQDKFKVPKSMISFMFRYGHTFLIIGNYVQLRSVIVAKPCDKSYSLMVLQAAKKLKDKVPTFQGIYDHLSPLGRERFRSPLELEKFCQLYGDFHENELHLKKGKGDSNDSKDIHQRVVDLQENFDQMDPSDVKAVLDSLANQLKAGMSTKTNNALQDPAIVSFSKKAGYSDFQALAPIETLDENDHVLEI